MKNNDEKSYTIDKLSDNVLKEIEKYESEIMSEYDSNMDNLDSIKDILFINDIEKPENNTKSRNKKDNSKIKSIHRGHRTRVRDKFLKYGFETFTEIEVLEHILFYAIPYKDTNELAHILIEKFGSLKSVMNAEHFELADVKGMGEYSAALIVMFRELQKYLNTSNFSEIVLDTSYKVGEFCINYFKNHVEESFIVLSLDNNSVLKCVDVISHGTETQTAFYPRKLMKTIVKNRTNAIILAHNHPDGSPLPSMNDLYLTTIIGKLMHNIGVTVIDHIICTDKNYISFSDKGMLTE